MKKNNIFSFFAPAIIVTLIIFGIIIFPSESISSAKSGFSVWVNILIPSLLPFIIGANLIVNLKFVDILGLIINPITKKLFNVSGKAGLVFMISMVSGYPVGAKLASELRINNEISKHEAQRLVSFCSTSGPLFIIGAVSIGMFKNPSLSYLMIMCHYLGALLVGFLFRNYGKDKMNSKKTNFKSEVSSIINSRFENNKGFFALLGDSINSGINTILMVGGFVIIFSVVFKILSLFKVISLFTSIITILLSMFNVSKELIEAFISGLFEITIGCNNIANLTFVPENIRASLCSFIISFSGLSILAQCSSFLAKANINIMVYTFTKFLHGIFSFIFTLLLYPLAHSSAPTFGYISHKIYNNVVWSMYINNYKIILPILILTYIMTTIFMINSKKQT